MNTFVVKSALTLEGRYIGLSEKDGQFIYIYKSHQEFKKLNPGVDTFTVLEGRKDGDKNKNKLRDEFDFRKNNICPLCGGSGAFYEIPYPSGKSSRVTYDEDGYVIFGEKVNVYCICNDVIRNKNYTYTNSTVTGTYVGYMEHEMFSVTRNIEELTDYNRKMKIYAMTTSSCQTCHGHSEMMYQYETCKECGLPGSTHLILGG